MLLWVTFALLTLAATAIVVWPLFAKRSFAANADNDLQLRLAVFRDRRNEIGREQAAGRLTDSEAEQARADLLRQMAEELPPEALASVDHPAAGAIEAGEATGAAGAAGAGGAAAVARAPRSSRAPIVAGIAVAILVPVLALGVYRSVGEPELAVAQLEGTLPRAGPQAQFDALVREIETRLKANPKDGEAWAVLAQAYKLIGNHGAAIEAFERAVELLPPNSRLLAEYAESAALAAGGDFAGKPTALLERALAADPKDQKAVALMGAASYRAGDLPRARRYLGELLASLPPESNEATQIRAIVEGIDADLRGGSAAESAPAPASPASTLRGTVTLSPELASRLPADATLFIVARAAAGPRIPVAVLRVPAAKLPAEFELGDANAMDPSRPLSSAGAVALEARLSASGDATRKPGDLYGEPISVKPGTSDIALVIDRVVEP